MDCDVRTKAIYLVLRYNFVLNLLSKYIYLFPVLRLLVLSEHNQKTRKAETVTFYKLTTLQMYSSASIPHSLKRHQDMLNNI